MEFSVSTLHGLEEKIQTLSDNISDKLNCKKLKDVTRELLKNRNVTKEILVDIVLNMGTVISESKCVLRSAVVKLDEQKSDILDNQRVLIQTQNDLISCKESKLDAVEETVKSFSDVVKKNCTGITPAKLKRVVKSAINEDDRTKNFLIFGADEEMLCENYPMDDKAFVDEIFTHVKLQEKPMIEKCSRVGTIKFDGAPRPIKVTLRTPDAVHHVLDKAKRLKTLDVKGYSVNFNSVYLSPDRSEEERDVRRKLVTEMKQKIKEDPSKRYYIKSKRVCVSDEPVLTP